MRTATTVRIGLSLMAWGWHMGLALASPIVETHDRLEVNWSNLRIRFYGEAQAGSELARDGFKNAEKKAWHDGLSYASEAVRNLNITTNESLVANPDKLSEDARVAARQISTSTFSYNTTYFSDGTVRVHLESVLPKALETSGLHFKQKEANEPAMTQFTGVVLRSDKAMKPNAAYQVVDENGTVLFDVKDMAEAAYKKNLMGRWFRRPSPGELADVVGKSPINIEVAAQGGKFVVPRSEWDKATEGHKSLLVNGAIAIAVP